MVNPRKLIEIINEAYSVQNFIERIPGDMDSDMRNRLEAWAKAKGKSLSEEARNGGCTHREKLRWIANLTVDTED